MLFNFFLIILLVPILKAENNVTTENSETQNTTIQTTSISTFVTTTLTSSTNTSSSTNVEPTNSTSQPQSPQPSTSNNLSVNLKNTAKIKAHASIMIVAWVFFSSNAIFIARYYDFLFKKVEITKGNFSTNLHRSFMALVIILSWASFFIILAELKGKWVDSSQGVSLAHSIIGIVAIGVSFIQGISGITKIFIRPKKPAKFLRYLHRLLGTFCFVLATVNIFFGIFVSDFASKKIAWGMMIGWVLWLVILFSILESLEIIYKVKEDHDRYIEEQEKRQDKEIDKDFFVEHVKKKETYQKFFETMLLVIQIVISSSITAALLFYINSS